MGPGLQRTQRKSWILNFNGQIIQIEENGIAPIYEIEWNELPNMEIQDENVSH